MKVTNRDARYASEGVGRASASNGRRAVNRVASQETTPLEQARLGKRSVNRSATQPPQLDRNADVFESAKTKSGNVK